MVTPHTKLPVCSLDSCLIGSEVQLACGTKVWALVGNVSTNDAYANKHLMGFTLFNDGKLFHLARYHDPEYDHNGPAGLAKFLGIAIDDIFPIQYDFRSFVSGGDPAALAGTIDKNPTELLNEDQLMDLIMRS